MAAPKVEDLIYRAYRLIQVIKRAGRSESDSQTNDGIRALNSLLDSWGANRLKIFTVNRNVFNLIPGTQVYTIGIDPTGNTQATLLAVNGLPYPRPTKLRNANIITQFQGGPSVRTPMELLNDDGWASIRVPNTGSSIPQQLYDDYDDPLSRLYFWPYPNAAAQVELFSLLPFGEYATGADQVLFPPGYRKALEYSLACELAPAYPEAVLSPFVVNEAAMARADIDAANAPEPVMSCDAGVLDQKKYGWNYLIGDYNP